MPNRPFPSIRFGWQLAAGLFVVLLLLGFGIPTVRASISAWLGVSVAPANQMPAETITLVAVPPQAPTPTILPAVLTPTTAQPQPTMAPTAVPTQALVSPDRPDEINQLSTQAGWRIFLPANLPEGYKYQSAYLDANHQMIILTYLVTRPLPGSDLTASKTITLLEALRNDFVPLQIAPDSKITDVQVNGQPAVFTIGAWDSQFVKDASDPNGGKMVSTWRNDLAVQNLYWQVGKVYLALVTDDDLASQTELIDLAASITQ